MFQTVYIDLMFIGKITFLIIVADPLDYTYVGLLKNRTTKDILVELRKGLREITNRGFKIIKGYIDGERGTNNQGIKSKTAEELEHQIWMDFHIQLDVSGAAEAVPRVEAKIRRIKERMRAVFHTLPYKLDWKLLVWLVRYATLRLNGEISTKCKDNLSGRERLYGRRNDKAWIRHGFGDYVQVHDKETNNTMKARTQGALALAPTGNMSGTWFYLNLMTWQVVRRNGATPLPMTDELIDYVNSKTLSKRADVDLNNEEEEEIIEIMPEDAYAEHQPALLMPVGGTTKRKTELKLGLRIM